MNVSGAPGRLEQVRAFLNTWEVPNDTRVAGDRLCDLADDLRRWRSALPDVPPPATPADTAKLAALRGQLRAALGQERPASLQPLVERGWRVRLGRSAGEPAVALVPDQASPQAAVLELVLAAINDGRWHRLRACPDCGWVFYDSSRNARRTWCSMTAEDGARGCGSIAKTRSYRNRQRLAHQDSDDSASRAGRRQADPQSASR